MCELFLFQATVFAVHVPFHTEIGLPTGSQFLSVDSDEEREEWAESIKRCSVSVRKTFDKYVMN